MCARKRGRGRQSLVLSLFFSRLHAVFGRVRRNATGSNSTVRQASATIYLSLCRIALFSGAESEESFKDFGKNREAMRLCREGECFSLAPGPKVYFGCEGSLADTHRLQHFVCRSVRMDCRSCALQLTEQPDVSPETDDVSVCVLYIHKNNKHSSSSSV